MNRSGYLLTSVLMLCGLFSQAQRVDFSGEWTLKDRQSISGTLYANASPKQITIKQDANTISIHKLAAGPSGDVKTFEDMTIDGQLMATGAHPTYKKTVNLTWSPDRQSCTMIIQGFNPKDSTKIDFTFTDIFSLKNGELVFDRKAENAMSGEVWEVKAIYDKQ